MVLALHKGLPPSEPLHADAIEEGRRLLVLEGSVELRERKKRRTNGLLRTGSRSSRNFSSTFSSLKTPELLAWDSSLEKSGEMAKAKPLSLIAQLVSTTVRIVRGQDGFKALNAEA